MRPPLVLALFTLAACTGAAPTYGYPGCDDAGTAVPICGTSPALLCAKATIAAAHARCAEDADCAHVTVTSSCDFSDCGFAVRTDQAGAFRDELANEQQRYCAAQANVDPGGSIQDGSCAFSPRAFCDPDALAFCDAGTCQLAAFDAGFFGD